MKYVKRHLHEVIRNLFLSKKPEGLILAGIVGAGKTTLINKVMEDLSSEYQTFSYTGDEVRFRENVSQSTDWLHEDIRSQTDKRALVFVDEVQKCESVFDVVKYAFDRGISFIVSGSNPHYLRTTARKRLQRRGEFITLAPFSLPELLEHEKLIPTNSHQLFRNFIETPRISLPESLGITVTPKVRELISTYLVFGGLPLIYQTEKRADKLREIRKVVERGFEAISNDTDDISDMVRIELARIHSREFTYQNILKQTGLRKRDIINGVIDGLIGHGYLHKKKPIIFEEGKRSYLSVFSYSDPGIVTYLSGDTTVEGSLGQRVEGVVHSQLAELLQLIPLKTQLEYFKPYRITGAGQKLNFMQGEIDFVITQGKSHIPIEVKSADTAHNLNVQLIKEFIKERNAPFGVVLYGGAPQWRDRTRLLLWPYWLV